MSTNPSQREQDVVANSDPDTATWKTAKEKMDAGVAYATKATLKGCAYGFIASSSLTALLHYAWPLYRSITIPGKLMWISAATLVSGVIAGEHAIYHFHRPWLKKHKKSDEDHSTDSIYHFVLRHRAEIGAMTAGGILLVALAILSRNQRLSGVQKFMNARLWAQGAGFGAALLAAGVGASQTNITGSSNNSKDTKKH